MTALQALDRSTVQEETSYFPGRLRVTEAEYWEKYYDHPDAVYEWHNGYLEEKSVSDYVTVSAYEFFHELLVYYLKTRPVAKLTVLEMGFRLTLPRETVIRRPDMGVVLNDNPIPLLPGDNSYKGTYDVCIEAISDDDEERDTITKKWEYAKGGVREYYILDGYGEETQFYRLNARGVYVPIRRAKGGLVKSKVLPGFQFREADLYAPLSPDELIEDSVYKGFVLPGYSKAKQETSKVKQQIRKAKQEISKVKQQVRKAKQETSKAKQEASEAKQETSKAKQEAGKAKQQASEANLLAEQEKQARLAAENRARESEAENARMKALLAGKTKTD